MTPEVSASSAVLAMNQGLYNGFLAAGLIWGIWKERRDIKLFFLSCVVVAGVFGGMTAKTSILFTQALPAVIAFALRTDCHARGSQIMEKKTDKCSAGANGERRIFSADRSQWKYENCVRERTGSRDEGRGGAGGLWVSMSPSLAKH